jgi:predicted GIY-YIG superfamily endonuclease
MSTNYLYRHFDSEGKLLYIGISLNALTRLSQHKKSKWIEDIANVKLEKFPDRQSAMDAEKNAIKKEHPLHNICHVEHVKPVSNVEHFNSNKFEKMTKKEAISIFGSPSKLARALEITPGAVSQWGNVLTLAQECLVIVTALRQGLKTEDELIKI